MADIDELKFSIILDDNKFKKKMEEVNTAAGKFEQSVKAALAVTNLLNEVQGKSAKNAEQQAKGAEKAAQSAEKQAQAIKQTAAAAGELEQVIGKLNEAYSRQESSMARLKELGAKNAEQQAKLVENQRAYGKAVSDAEVSTLRAKTGIVNTSDIDLMKKYLDLVKEIKKNNPSNKGTDSQLWSTSDKGTEVIVDRLAKKWGMVRSEVEKYIRTFQEAHNAKYSFGFDTQYGLYNLFLQERSKDSDWAPKMKELQAATKAAKDRVKELTEEESRLESAIEKTKEQIALSKKETDESRDAVEKLTAAKQKLEAATKSSSGVGRTSSVSKNELNAVKELKEEEEKIYNLAELRRKRKEQSGQLTKDEVQVLKQMESIEKALLNVKEQHKGELSKEFSYMMNIEGMTKQQVGSYQSLVMQMQAATGETAKREAAEKASAMLREQKESAILSLKKAMVGVDQAILSAETQVKVQKGLAGELTVREIANLKTVIATERQRIAAQQKAAAETAARESALIGLRQKLNGINKEILSAETKQKIVKAEALQLTSKEITQLTAQIGLESAIANKKEQQRASSARISSELTRQTSLMRGLSSYVARYVSVFGAATILRSLIRITGEFEAQHTALRAILQDTAAADNIFNQLQVLAVKSPYTFQNLVSYAKQLTAFSIPVNEVYETTKKLADVSAGLGVDMGRIILAYGQVRSAEFLRGQEVRQFTEAGIPILSELAKQFAEIEGHAISVGEVFNRISARQVPFEMVEEAFNRMTSAGGKFYNMQEVLAETVKGKVANLRDAWEIMLSKIGDDHSGTIKGVVMMMTNLFANYEKWIGYLSAVIKGLGVYVGALAISNTATKICNTAQTAWNTLKMLGNAQLSIGNILLPTQNRLQRISIANNMEEAKTLAALSAARKMAFGILGAVAGVIALVWQRQKRLREENEAASRAMDELTRSYRENLSLFAVGWNDLEKAYKRVADERHNAYKRALEENKGLLPDISESTKKLIEDSNKVVGPVETIRRKIEEVTVYGGELDAAVVSISRHTKTLVSDGGELAAAVVVADAKVKQLVSDGGELDAAVVTAAGGSLPKLKAALVDTAHSLKEAHLAGEPVRKSQLDIEKQFSASKESTDRYKAALDELYKKFPNFIDENVRQKIAVEDLAGAWDIATQNMKQYYAENASHQSHEILNKDFKEDTNKIVEDLNVKLRTGREFKQYRQNGLINEGSIQLIDAYVMGLKTEDELSEDLKRLIYLLNSAGETAVTGAEGDFKGPAAIESGGNLIEQARALYLARVQEFHKAVETADDVITKDFTSTRHKQVREFLSGEGVAEDSDLMMRNGTAGFESWQSWQMRLREMYEKTGEENRKVIQKMFDHFGLVVSADGLNPAQTAVSEWMKANPAPKGVSMAGFNIKPETEGHRGIRG